MKELIEFCRKRIGPAPRSFSFFERRYNRLNRPKSMEGRQETPLDCIYQDQEILYNQGAAVWGYIVQANDQLFEPGDRDLPAALVFSEDPYFDDHLETLEDISASLYDLKGRTDVSPETARFAEVISDQYIALFNAPLPGSLTEGRKVYYTTIVVHRRHLPDGVLRQNCFPILAAPRQTKAAIILPSKYWPEVIRGSWSKNAG
jgi:hypothetical protein